MDWNILKECIKTTKAIQKIIIQIEKDCLKN